MKKDNGDDFFKLIKIGLACKECLEKGLQCPHLVHKLPAWRPAERQAMLASIMANNPDLADREMRGIVKSNRLFMFERAWIKALAEREPYSWTYSPSVLWVAVDPSGGGTQSDFAIATLGYENARHVLVGMDKTNKVKHNLVVSMIESHLRALRKISHYKKAHIFVLVERNYGNLWSTDIIRTIVEQAEFAPITVLSFDESKEERPGIWMTKDIKECATGALQRSLADGQLCIASNFINAYNPDRGRDIKKDFREQLSNFRKERLVPKDEATQETKTVLTGKSSGGRRDDLVLVVMIALYFSGLKRIDSSFREQARKMGWRL